MNNIEEISESENKETDEVIKVSIWLRLFQIINYAWVLIYPIFSLLAGLIVLFGDFDSQQERNDYISYIIEYFPPFLFSLLIVKRLKVKSNTTPTKIKSLLNIEFGVKFVVGISLYMLFKNDLISEKPESLLVGLLYYLIWSSYFKRSKRVLSYYGANAQ